MRGGGAGFRCRGLASGALLQPDAVGAVRWPPRVRWWLWTEEPDHGFVHAESCLGNPDAAVRPPRLSRLRRAHDTLGRRHR